MFVVLQSTDCMASKVYYGARIVTENGERVWSIIASGSVNCYNCSKDNWLSYREWNNVLPYSHSHKLLSATITAYTNIITSWLSGLRAYLGITDLWNRGSVWKIICIFASTTYSVANYCTPNYCTWNLLQCGSVENFIGHNSMDFGVRNLQFNRSAKQSQRGISNHVNYG
jgi:hypothetical protein